MEACQQPGSDSLLQSIGQILGVNSGLHFQKMEK